MVQLSAPETSYGEGNEKVTLTRELVEGVFIYTLAIQHGKDNRLTPNLISKAIHPALDTVEREWRADRSGKLKGEGTGGKAALITVGTKDHRFYSNGLNFELALATPGFFDGVLAPVHVRLLTFPIPSVAAINGHAFAGGMTIALAQDFRVIKASEGKSRALMCMNEIEFGANIPPGMTAILKAKIRSPTVMRDILLAGRYDAKEALKAGFVDAIGQNGDEVIKIARDMAVKLAPRAVSGIWGLLKQEQYREFVEAAGRSMDNWQNNDDDEAEERLALSAKL